MESILAQFQSATHADFLGFIFSIRNKSCICGSSECTTAASIVATVDNFRQAAIYSLLSQYKAFIRKYGLTIVRKIDWQILGIGNQNFILMSQLYVHMRLKPT